MKVDNYKSVLSLIAEIGVVIGILLLFFELQQNTDVARTSSYQQSIQSINEIRMSLAADPELARIYATTMSSGIEDFEDIDLVRVRYVMNSLLGIYENAYFLAATGIFTEQEWGRFSRPACAVRSRHAEIMERLSSYSQIVITEEFENYLNEVC